MLVIVRAIGGEFKVSTLHLDINFSCKSALSYSKPYLLDIYPYLLELNVLVKSLLLQAIVSTNNKEKERMRD